MDVYSLTSQCCIYLFLDAENWAKNLITYQWYPVNQCDLRHFFIPRQIFDSIRPNDQLSVKPASLINVLLNLHSMHTAVRLYFKSIQHLPLIFPAEPGSHKQDTLQVPALHDVCRYTFHSSCCFCYERRGEKKKTFTLIYPMKALIIPLSSSPAANGMSRDAEKMCPLWNKCELVCALSQLRRTQRPAPTSGFRIIHLVGGRIFALINTVWIWDLCFLKKLFIYLLPVSGSIYRSLSLTYLRYLRLAVGTLNDLMMQEKGTFDVG